MKSKKLALLVATALVLMLSTAVLAGDEAAPITVKGKISCAKCSLGMKDATECQDVLVVTSDKGDPTYYYLVTNDVMEEFGHTCRGAKTATVTGTIATKDDKTWLTPSKMEPVEQS